jgi:hypothetical protein
MKFDPDSIIISLTPNAGADTVDLSLEVLVDPELPRLASAVTVCARRVFRVADLRTHAMPHEMEFALDMFRQVLGDLFRNFNRGDFPLWDSKSPVDIDPLIQVVRDKVKAGYSK